MSTKTTKERPYNNDKGKKITKYEVYKDIYVSQLNKKNDEAPTEMELALLFEWFLMVSSLKGREGREVIDNNKAK